MKQSRLDELSDGIFAIAMTVLVFNIRVPNLIPGTLSNTSLFHALSSIVPSLLSYLLSFALLFTYWRAHHFFSSVYAKNVDLRLTNINAIFLLFVALVPFSTSLLSSYSQSQVAIAVYALNIILIGLALFWMRRHVFRSKTIERVEISPRDKHNGTVRILVPVVSAIGAVLLSFVNTKLSLFLFTFAILFNLSASSTSLVNKIIGVKDEAEEATSPTE